MERLTPFLDLDDESESDERLYAELLDDGTVLVHTFQPFELFEQDPEAVEEWLAQFGDALADVHDDPRGLLFFGDDEDVEATTYEGVVAEVGDKGFFVELEGAGGLDMGALEGLAEQLLAGQQLGGAPGGSFAIGQLFQDMQKQLVDALGGQGEGARADSDIVDDEFEGEPESAPKK